jgi:hypothetical protein
LSDFWTSLSAWSVTGWWGSMSIDMRYVAVQKNAIVTVRKKMDTPIPNKRISVVCINAITLSVDLNRMNYKLFFCGFAMSASAILSAAA